MDNIPSKPPRHRRPEKKRKLRPQRKETKNITKRLIGSRRERRGQQPKNSRPTKQQMRSASFAGGFIRRTQDGQTKLLRPQRVGGILSLRVVRNFVLSARIVSLAGLLACLWILSIIARNERFTTGEFAVEGLTYTAEANLIQWMQANTEHSFMVNPSQLAKKFSEYPGVQDAKVSVTWPNQVAVTLVEEAPVLIWQENDVQYWVTASGAIVPLATEIENLPIIVAELPRKDPISQIDRTLDMKNEDDSTDVVNPSNLYFPSIPAHLIESILTLHELKPNAQIRFTLRHGLQFTDKNEIPVYVGHTSDVARKVANYEAVKELIVQKEISAVYIDVRSRDAFYKPAGSSLAVNGE